MKTIVRDTLPIIMGVMLVFFNSSVYACATTGQPPPPGLLPTGVYGQFPDTIVVCAGQPIDLEANYTATPPTNTSVTFIWNWGDGISETIPPPFFPKAPVRSHTYVASGNYVFELIKTSSDGADTSYIVIKVLASPKANFSSNVSGAFCQGDTVFFKDLSTPQLGPPINAYYWDFGDGNTSIFQNPAHNYTYPGKFMVSLTVTNGNNCPNTFFDTILVKIDTTIITGINWTSGCPCNDFNFTSVGINTISWNWNFGDGFSSSSPNSQHTYSLPGQHHVSLTGTNAAGCTQTLQGIVEVCPNDTLWTSKSNNQWFFPNTVGVNFNTGSPVLALGGQATNIEGGSTVCNPETGNLLFYADENNIWDASHTVMPGGANLSTSGWISTEQGTLIVPDPGNKNRYYLFINSGVSSKDPYAIRYCTIDMTLPGNGTIVAPLGNVVTGQRNILLTTTEGHEGLSATPRILPGCGKTGEYWVMVCTKTGEHKAFLVTAAGINPPVVTNLGNVSGSVISPSAFSPSGSLYVIGGSDGSAATIQSAKGINLFNFNRTTGQLSNVRHFDWGMLKTYGHCFSPNGKLLYISGSGTGISGGIWQLDVSQQDILGSLQKIAPNDNYGIMWTGEDNRIYMTRASAGDLGVITNPNTSGIGCNYVNTGFNLGGKSSQYGLQNLQKRWVPIQDTSFANFTANTTNCLSVSFTNLSDTLNYTDPCSFLANNDTLLNYTWDFGDGNTSTQFSPTHSYSTGGNYSVSLTVTRPFTCAKNRLTKTITISSPPVVTVTPSSISICTGSSTVLTANGASSYTWSPASGLSATTGSIVTSTPGSTITYTVTGFNSAGCSNTSTVIVTVNPAISVSLTANNVTCSGGVNGSLLSNPSGGTSPYAYSWSAPGAQTSQTATGLSAGIYTVTITDAKGCTATSSTSLTSPSSLSGQFTKGTAICAGCGCKEWIMVTASGGTRPYTYLWPDGYVNRYKNQLCPGAYTINIKDKNGCSVNLNLTAP